METSKIFCEIIAEDIDDPINNKYIARTMQDNQIVQDERAGSWKKQTLTYSVMQSTKEISNTTLRMAVNIFMTMWDIETNLTLKPSNINPDIRIFFKTSLEEKYFKDRPSVLAYAYYPEQGSVSGIMVFNDDYYWNLTGEEVDAYLVDPVHYTKGDGKKIRGYNLLAVGGHEFGHVLGLTHSTNPDGTDLMLPYYNPKVIWASLNDIARMLLKYPQEARGIWYNSRMRAWVRRRILKFKTVI